MNQLLQTFDLALQLHDKQGFALVVPFEALDMLSSGGNRGGFGTTLEGVFCVFDVEACNMAFGLPARDLGSEVVQLRLELVAIATLDEVVRCPSRMCGSRHRNLAFG
jgi:hypothetical protein